MSESLLSVRPAFGVWNRGALRIEYGLGVLEEIRRTVQEGFHKIPHGGVETGGLLYGQWNGETLTVAAWRPVQCEHPLGPRFQLSGADELALVAQLATDSPELENYQVVGWFASHSRGALQLRGPDVDLHAKYFPEPWQPILLLCSSRNQPMQAAFYSHRDSTLMVGAEVTPMEVVPNPTAVPRRMRRMAPRQAEQPAQDSSSEAASKMEVGDSIRILATQVGSEPPQMIPPELRKEPAAPAEASWAPLDAAAASPWASRGYEREESPEAPVLNVAPAPRAPADPPLEQPEVVSKQAVAQPFEITIEDEAAPKFTFAVDTERKMPWKRLAWATLWLAIAAGGVYSIPRLSFPVAAAPSVGVKISEVSGAVPGQLSIRWKVNGAASSALRSGQIQVIDSPTEGPGAKAGQPQSFILTSGELRSGTLTYWRQSDHLDVKVTLQGDKGEAIAGQANFAAPQPAAEPSAEVKALRNQLRMQRNRGRALESELAGKRPR